MFLPRQNLFRDGINEAVFLAKRCRNLTLQLLEILKRVIETVGMIDT